MNASHDMETPDSLKASEAAKAEAKLPNFHETKKFKSQLQAAVSRFNLHHKKVSFCHDKGLIHTGNAIPY